MSVDGAIDSEWRAFITAKRDQELDQIISEENLRSEEAHRFLEVAFRDGALRTSGTDITSVLPPVPRFSRGGQHGVTKRRVIERLTGFFERFLGLV